MLHRKKLETIAFVGMRKLYKRYQTHIKDDLQDETEGFIPDERIKTLGIPFEDFKKNRKFMNKFYKNLPRSNPYKLKKVSYKDLENIFAIVSINKMISCRSIRIKIDSYLRKGENRKLLMYLEGLGFDFYFLTTSFSDLNISFFKLLEYLIDIGQSPIYHLSKDDKKFYYEILKPLMIKCFNGNLSFTFSKIESKLSYI